jgi:hypothetical protein
MPINMPTQLVNTVASTTSTPFVSKSTYTLPPGWQWFENDPPYRIAYPLAWRGTVGAQKDWHMFSSPETMTQVRVHVYSMPETVDTGAWVEWVRQNPDRWALSQPLADIAINATFLGQPALFLYQPSEGGSNERIDLLFAYNRQLFQFLCMGGGAGLRSAEISICREMLATFQPTGLFDAQDMSALTWPDISQVDAPVTITAVIREVSPEVDVITLEKPVEGFVTVTSMEGNTAVSWDDFATGAEIEATGQIGPAGTLLTQEIRVSE